MNLKNYKAVMVANITNVTNGNIAFSTTDIKEAHKVCDAYNTECTIARTPSLYVVKLQTVWMKKKILEYIE